MTDVLLIAGSPTIQSRSGAVITSLSERLEGCGLSTFTLRVRDLDAEALLHARQDHPQLADALNQVARANSVIVATPVYKASFSGLLKLFLDLLPQSALSGKAVLPAATAGTGAHLLAIDYALKPVLSALGVLTFLPSLYIQDAHITQVNPPVFDPEVERRMTASVDALRLYLSRLTPVIGELT
ncbi:MAG: NADPH-dependent FMN reductase [bacterium]|nr:NADPH-dependent FMN reductase [bacterium]